MCFSNTEQQLGIHLQTVRKSVFLWVETEVLLLQKKESDRQHKLASPSAASLLRILVLLEITVVIFLKNTAFPKSGSLSLLAVRSRKVSVGLAVWDSVCLMTVSHENFSRSTSVTFEKKKRKRKTPQPYFLKTTPERKHRRPLLYTGRLV